MKFISDITVDLVDTNARDLSVVQAAKVSTIGNMAVEESNFSAQSGSGLINYLIQHRHGTPFEHNVFTFFVHAPIFVWREWHRHRIGFSYNEESARYKQLEPVFYLPPPDRPMFKVDDWKPGKPKFLTLEQYAETMSFQHESSERIELVKQKYNKLLHNLKTTYTIAYRNYEDNLDMGFDPGLARDCLPVGIYSSCWVTCNARSLMAFLSLRTHDPLARDISYPLYEIEVAARKLEQHFAYTMPITYNAFVKYGRRAP